jgi:hypothetical protein
MGEGSHEGIQEKRWMGEGDVMGYWYVYTRLLSDFDE